MPERSLREGDPSISMLWLGRCFMGGCRGSYRDGLIGGVGHSSCVYLFRAAAVRDAPALHRSACLYAHLAHHILLSRQLPFQFQHNRQIDLWLTFRQSPTLLINRAS
eukprot:scaffold32106_cov72-Skeletonema_dohrnii-CCMP3373.AAC.2